MIIRKIEVCPTCGQVMPWRKYATKIVRGQKRIYVRCCRCGARDTVIYTSQNAKSTQTGY